jgi:hypothetical protein
LSNLQIFGPHYRDSDHADGGLKAIYPYRKKTVPFAVLGKNPGSITEQILWPWERE